MLLGVPVELTVSGQDSHNSLLLPDLLHLPLSIPLLTDEMLSVGESSPVMLGNVAPVHSGLIPLSA